MINYTVFGDINKYPVIKSLVNILNETKNKNEFKYCSNFINEYNVTMNYLDSIDNNKMKLYFMKLNKNNFLDRLKVAKLNNLIYTHMCNLIIGVYRNKIKN